MRRRMAKRIKKVGVAESVAQQLSMLVRCLGRHANYLRAHLLPGIPCEFVARDQLRCRSEQPVPCRDEAPRRRPWTSRAGRGARAPARQATSRHAPPDACRHPILASKPFLPTAYLVAERTFWYVLAPAEGLHGQEPVANRTFARASRINWPPLGCEHIRCGQKNLYAVWCTPSEHIF